MDFSFSVNELFKEEIAIVDNMLEVCRRGDSSRERFRQLQNKVYEIVDKMGEASAKAQGLHNTITTGRKLSMSGHRLYLMKDSNGNSGRGSIVGLLKVGTKKLFVYDSTKVQHEIQPLCVLDFYIHESRQRMGCGRKLFDFMLGKEHILAQHLAIDRPSSKFLSFMAKHYNLRVLIPQVYNFVVFEGFFYNRSDLCNSQFRRAGDDQNYWMKSPMSGSDWRSHNPEQLYKNVPKKWTMQESLRHNEGHMGASQRMYSRHEVVAGGYCNDRPVSTRNSCLQDSWSAHSRTHYNHHNSHAATAGDQKCFDPELLSSKQMNQSPTEHSNSTSNHLQDSASTPDFGGHTRNGVSSPVVLNVNCLPHTTQATPSFQLSEISTNYLHQRPSSVLTLGALHQPANRADNYLSNKKGLNPALQQQGSPLVHGEDMFIVPQKYQQRNEQHSVPTGISALVVSDICSSQAKTPVTFGRHGNPSAGRRSPNNFSWTVTGVLLDQQVNAVIPRTHTTSNHSLWGHKNSL